MSTSAGTPDGPQRALASGPLAGRVRVAGDPAFGRLALMLGALALGESLIEGLPESADMRATIGALRAFGATLSSERPGHWRLRGVGVGGFLEPEAAIACPAASGALPLLLGLIASQGLAATFVADDADAGAIPLGRVLDPLRRIGAQVIARSRERLPLTMQGAEVPLPIDYRLPAPLSDVKSAVLLAGLNAPGVTSVIEPVAVQDQTERMLAAFGAAIETDRDSEGARVVRIEGRRDLKPQALVVPGDPGAAAAVIVAALVVEGSDVTIEGVLVNPLRMGLVDTLIAMGGDIALANTRIIGGEPVADIRVRASRLAAVAVPAARMPLLVEDLAALAVAAGFAEGRTVLEGLGGLRLEQPGLIGALAAGLAASGIAAEEGPESLVVTGSARPAGGGAVAARGDARLAAAFLALGLGAADGVAVDTAATEAAAFTALMTTLGARFEQMETIAR